MNTLASLTFGMLGLGAMRTIERVKRQRTQSLQLAFRHCHRDPDAIADVAIACFSAMDALSVIQVDVAILAAIHFCGAAGQRLPGRHKRHPGCQDSSGVDGRCTYARAFDPCVPTLQYRQCLFLPSGVAFAGIALV